MLSDNDRSLIISRNISRNLKEYFPNHKRKHNVSLVSWSKYQRTWALFGDKKQESWYDSEVKVLLKKSSDGKKQLNLTLNSINVFPISLVITFVGSWYKILRISWYKYMTPFRENLQQVIKNYLCHFMIHYLVLTIFQAKCFWVDWVSKFFSIPLFLKSAIYFLVKLCLQFELISVSDHIQKMNLIQENI